MVQERYKNDYSSICDFGAQLTSLEQCFIISTMRFMSNNGRGPFLLYWCVETQVVTFSFRVPLISIICSLQQK